MARKSARKLRLVPHLPLAQLGWVGAKAVLTLVLLFGLVAALVWIGGRAGQSVAHRDRYAVAVADIRCDVPPGTDRAAFLAEVRYLGRLPESVQAVDSTLSATLSSAFARHPWVAAVRGVTVGPDGSISVALAFRQPVLVVKVRGESPRMVDATGVLLPVSAPPAGTTVLDGEWIPPTVSPGAVWPDPTIKRAVELAVAYKPAALQKLSAGGWRLIMPDGRGFTVAY